MKIFTVLIISFNSIFTLSQNINNDKITANSLIRNKIQSNKVYNFEIKNLEKGYYKEFIIKNYGFKDESYFYHKTSTNLIKINENILKIKAFNKTLIAGNNYLQLLRGENEIWKYDTTNTNDYYLIKYLFETLNYLNVKFSFFVL